MKINTFLSFTYLSWLSSPDAWLYLRFKGLVFFVNIFMKGKYSSNYDISWCCSCWNTGTPHSSMSCFQNKKENCDMHMYTESNHGQTALFSALLLNFVSKLPPLLFLFVVVVGLQQSDTLPFKHLQQVKENIPFCFLLHSLQFSSYPLEPCPLVHN